MKYFLDTEFIEAPGHLDLISIGIVSEAGDQLYLENSEVDWSRASQWVLDNVKPHLGLKLSTPDPCTKKHIGKFVRDWIDATSAGAKPEFWGYYADYDWVLFCWLQGTMMELPEGWPKYCNDLKQLVSMFESESEILLAHTGAEHHALADALWLRDAYNDLLDRRAGKIMVIER